MEGRSQSAVTHLATARRQTVRNGILGLQKIKAARDRCFIFYKKKSEKEIRDDFALSAVNQGKERPIGRWFLPLGRFVLVPAAAIALIAGALLGGIG